MVIVANGCGTPKGLFGCPRESLWLARESNCRRMLPLLPPNYASTVAVKTRIQRCLCGRLMKFGNMQPSIRLRYNYYVCTAGGNQARSDTRTEFQISGEAGRAIDRSWPRESYAPLTYTSLIYASSFSLLCPCLRQNEHNAVSAISDEI